MKIEKIIEEEILGSKAVEGTLEIRPARNNNDLLNNILPQATSKFVGALVSSLTDKYIKVKGDAEKEDIKDALELHVKDTVQRWVNKNASDWVTEDNEGNITKDEEVDDFTEEDIEEDIEEDTDK